MFGKNDLVENLSRNLDRARGKRDGLASDVTTLTAQIAEIEARLSEEKTRRECDRVLGDIEAIKKRIKQTASAVAPGWKAMADRPSHRRRSPNASMAALAGSRSNATVVRPAPAFR